MYSNRIAWNAQPNQLSQHFQKLRRDGTSVLDLTISNPTSVLATYPHAAIAEALGAIPSVSYEPAAGGSEEARECLAQLSDAPPSRIFLAASTSEAYSMLFKLLCNPGDEVLVPVPSYPLFEYLAALDSVRVAPYRLLYDGSWYLDIDSLSKSISPRTKAIVVVSPNNPTGSYLKPEEAIAVAAIAASHNLAILSDEVFRDYPLGVQRPSRFGDAALSFTLNGLSKFAGMPQMKLAWIVINGPADACLDASSRLEFLLDTYLSVATPVQKALPRLLEIGASIRHELGARMRLNHSVAQAVLTESAAHCLHVEAGWSAIVQLPRTQTEEDWAMQLLTRKQVLVQPGYFFDMHAEAFAVVSLVSQPEIFAEGMERLRALIQSSG